MCSRKKDQKESKKEQTQRFAFENVTYDTRDEVMPNGGTEIPNGRTLVANKGISASQNGSIPYSSPLGGAVGGNRKHGAIFNNAHSVQEGDEKIHIYDHHQNRPVQWPPEPPSGVRLSFRESKTRKGEEDPPYEDLPAGNNYETLPPINIAKEQNINNSNNMATIVAIDPPPPPNMGSRATLQDSLTTPMSRVSVSLNSGLDDELTNITQSMS